MSGGFSNPIVGGGGALVYPSIHSPNFNVANPAASPNPSWAILKNGLAYFFGLALAGGTITGPDYIINTSGIFIYSGTPATGNLIGSWAGAAGNDGLPGGGNAYPQGFNITKGAITGTTFAGTDFVINSAGVFFYSGAPAAGNLIFSVTPAAITDAHTNSVLPGLVTYNGSNAVAFDPGTLAMTGYTNSSGQSGAWTANTTVMLTSGAVVNPGVLYLAGTATGSIALPSPGIGIVYASTNGTPSGVTHGVFIGQIPLTQVNPGVSATGNVTAFTLITNLYTLDSTLIANTLYVLRVPFNGVWGAQIMTIGADINGAVTTLGTVGAVFAAGTVSGDAVNGYIEIEVFIVSAAACRISCKGVIHDNTLNANNSATVTSAISTTVATGVAIAGGNTLGISVKFAGSVAGQTITPAFEIFTRNGGA